MGRSKPKPMVSEVRISEPPRPIRDRSHDVLREMREMQMEIEVLKKAVLSQTNAMALEQSLAAELEKIKKEVRHSSEKSRHTLDKMEAEIRFIREDVNRIISIEKEMERISAKSMERDIEGLKMKSQWLETHVKGFDIDPIVERISELEDSIKILKASQPVVWE